MGGEGFTLTDHEESRCQTHSGKTSHLVAKCAKQEWGGKDDGEENLQHWPAITLSNRVSIILTRMQFRKMNLVIFYFTEKSLKICFFTIKHNHNIKDFFFS